MHAEAGDTLQITLRNLLKIPVNLEPFGNGWNIGSMLKPIPPGTTVTFTIEVPLTAGPLAEAATGSGTSGTSLTSAAVSGGGTNGTTGQRQSSVLYMYRSSLNPTLHENTGLMGPLIVTRKGDANADGTPRGVDREMVTLFQV